MGRGRKTTGLDLIKKCPASNLAKARFEAYFSSLNGTKTIGQAAQELGITGAAFCKGRSQWLHQALEALEPKPLGRPAKEADPQEQVIAGLEGKIRDLTIKIKKT